MTRSQRRLTQEQFASLKDVPGFAAQFLVDSEVPTVGAVLKLFHGHPVARWCLAGGLAAGVATVVLR